MDFLPIWEFSRRFYKIDNPKSHFPERRCENQTSAGGAKYISLRFFLCSDCLSFLVQISSWSWFLIFLNVFFFSGKQWLSNWVVIYPELQQRLVCWIEQLQSSRPCRSRWMFKSLRKNLVLFSFSPLLDFLKPQDISCLLFHLIRVPLGEQSILMKC